MASLTNISQGTFHSVHLIDDAGTSSTEVRDLFMQGSVKQSITAQPQSTDILGIPGLIGQLNAKRNISDSYS